MPFPFALPTTSHLEFQSHYSSATHPSLPGTATLYRSVLRSTLKKHKRLSPSAQAGNLSTILSAIDGYLPYLLALDAGLSGRPIGGEDVDIVLDSEIAVEWRPMLASSQVPSRDAARVKGLGLDFEIAFVMQTYASVQTLLAREQLAILYGGSVPSTEQRVSAVQSASKNLIMANSLHTFILQRCHSTSDTVSMPPAAVDILPSVQSGLLSLSLAEATLLFVLKDDPYPAITIQSRSKTDKEWMIKAPDIPKVRVLLFARLSLAAAENAGKAAASLSSAGPKVSSELVRYTEDLRRVARAKACRFFGLDADAGGKTGEGIAWLRAGLNELGFSTASGSSSTSGSLSKLKSSIQSHRTASHILKPGSNNPNWGLDAGKLEEQLTLSTLEKKWVKMNDTVNVQLVPDFAPLVASMPSGREVYTAKPWKPSEHDLLPTEELTRMRAPLDTNDEISRKLGGMDLGDSSDDELKADGKRPKDPVGAFPGTKGQYSASKDETSYY